MTKKEAKQRLAEMLPQMVENYRMKELSYLDAQDNTGDSDTYNRLFDEFRKYRDQHNKFVEELAKLSNTIDDDAWVNDQIDRARGVRDNERTK